MLIIGFCDTPKKKYTIAMLNVQLVKYYQVNFELLFGVVVPGKANSNIRLALCF
jgi:hypothetical protein